MAFRKSLAFGVRSVLSASVLGRRQRVGHVTSHPGALDPCKIRDGDLLMPNGFGIERLYTSCAQSLMCLEIKGIFTPPDQQTSSFSNKKMGACQGRTCM
jgi:hypothetical protein